MKTSPLLCLFLAFMACQQKPQPVNNNTITDSIISATDTAYNPYTEEDRIKDSLQFAHARDSFLAIKPLAIFYSDIKSHAWDKLVASIIDTNGVTSIPLKFTDTTITKLRRSGNLITSRQICRNNQFLVEMINHETDTNYQVRLFIDSHELRPGIEIDTSVTGPFELSNLELDTAGFAFLQFGLKKYLFLPVKFHNCTGNGCNVYHYILYDPAIRKAMLLEQYRSYFTAGYDKRTNTPVFVDMYESLENEPYSGGYRFSGKAYRFVHTGKVEPMLNEKGKQLHFQAYSPSTTDTFIVFNGTLNKPLAER